MGKVIFVGNQKGGVGKITTCVNLGTALALAQAGEKVCLIDLDPQGNLTQSLGYRNPDEMECTIAEVLKSEIQLCDNLSRSLKGAILHHEEGLDPITSVHPSQKSKATLDIVVTDTDNQYKSHLYFPKLSVQAAKKTIEKLTELYNKGT